MYRYLLGTDELFVVMWWGMKTDLSLNSYIGQHTKFRRWLSCHQLYNVYEISISQSDLMAWYTGIANLSAACLANVLHSLLGVAIACCTGD